MSHTCNNSLAAGQTQGFRRPDREGDLPQMTLMTRIQNEIYDPRHLRDPRLDALAFDDLKFYLHK